MDLSYKLRNFFLKTVKTLNELKQKEKLRKEQKLKIIKELEDDLFYIKESAKKLLRENKIKQEQYGLLIQKILKINDEVKKIKKNLIAT
jgi:hypothetical protein